MQSNLFDIKYNEMYCGKYPCVILEKDKTHVLIQFESGTKIATPHSSLNENYGKK
jgi:hypothetical protein